MHFILSSSKYVIKMRYCQRIYWLLGKRLVIRQKICYHTRVKSEGESGVSRHSPDPRNQRGPAWSASNSYEYTWNARGSQYPSDGRSLPITSHRWFRSCGSSGKERMHEAILLR